MRLNREDAGVHRKASPVFSCVVRYCGYIEALIPPCIPNCRMLTSEGRCLPGCKESFSKEKETPERKGGGKSEFPTTLPIELPTEFWTQEELGEIVGWLKDDIEDC